MRPEISQIILVVYLQPTAISSSQKVLGVPPFFGSRGNSIRVESVEVFTVTWLGLDVDNDSWYVTNFVTLTSVK